jgi:hypothetical protein
MSGLVTTYDPTQAATGTAPYVRKGPDMGTAMSTFARRMGRK